MKKYLLISFSLAVFSFSNLYGQKSKLYFNTNGEFKIVQFTDMHMQKHDPELELASAREIVALEKPDLVVITGDITCQDSVENLLSKLASTFAEKKIYWAVALGNHDDERTTTREFLYQLYRSLPYNINLSPSEMEGRNNFVIPIAGKKGKHEALLYFLDSKTYNPLFKKAENFESSQINWYRNQSTAYTKMHKGIPIPALSFFHIPLPEYNELWKTDSISCIGSKGENVCSEVPGLYTSMLECGDVMGIFVGHDHENDYIGSYHGIALAYGRFSGGRNTYGSLTRGARVIVLKENKREFDTWIREKGGNVSYPCIYKNSKIIKY